MQTDLPPRNIEAEEAVLASCVFDQVSMAQAVDILIPEDFYKTANRKIFNACVQLYRKEIPADLVALASHLRKKDELDSIGGPTYLSSLSTNAPMAVNIQHYCKLVKDASTRRHIITAAHEMINACHFDNDTVTVLDTAQKSLIGIDVAGFDGRVTQVSDLIGDRYDHWEKISKSPNSVTGIPSGLSIDEITCGFQNTDLIILAGRPSMGKTALATTMIGNMARKGFSIGMFSLEMSSPQLIDRMAASEAKIDGFRLKTGKIKPDHWKKLNVVSNQIHDWKLFIDDTAGLSHMGLRRRARRMYKQGGVDIIFIDYLQLMTGDRKEGRVREIGSISREMKGLAKELNIPIVLLAQLSRAVEMRDNKRPRLSDLRDSGEVEQDADVVVFIYRDEVYFEKSSQKGIAELSVSKHRNGPTGMKRLVWLEAFTRFESLT